MRTMNEYSPQSSILMMSTKLDEPSTDDHDVRLRWTQDQVKIAA